jgi:single-strand DNA-binding protein
MSKSDVNIVSMIGYLGADPVVEVSNSGVTYARFSLACNQAWKASNGDRKKRTDWFQVVAFNGLAKTLVHLRKGDQVAVGGRLQSKTYVDKHGVTRTVVEIVATTVQFLRLKDRPVAGAQDDCESSPGDDLGPGYEDDIPF